MSEPSSNQLVHLSKERVDSIINLSESSNKRLVLNNEYVCYFISPDPDSKDSKFFSSWERDTNCPRESCYAFAKVYSTVKMSTTYGMVFVANDKDLSCEHSIMLCLLDSKKPMAFNDLFEVKESGGWTSMVTVTGVHDTVMPMKFRDFMKFIKYKPERNPNEPEESLGLGVATFDCPNKQYAGIEYSITGSAYYEAIDQRQYVEGDMVQSVDRYDVKKVDMLTEDVAGEFANHINRSLDKIFMGKNAR